MHRCTQSLLLALLLPIAFASCGRQSAFDKAAKVDVCGLAARSAVERIVGRLSVPPQAGAGDYGPGFAGSCTWSFKTADGNGDGTLAARLMTQGSRPSGPPFDPWSEVNLKEAEVNLGTATDMKGMGDRAVMFHAPGSSLSEAWIQLRGSWLAIRMTGGSSSQLVEFAQVVVGNIAARQSGSLIAENTNGSVAAASAQSGADVGPARRNAADARAITRQAQASAAIPGAQSMPAGQKADDPRTHAKEAEGVILAMAYVENCIRTDDLVRNICSRLGRVMPESDKAICKLPTQTFQQRTAAGYEAFKRTYAAQISTNASFIASTLDDARHDFEREFGAMRHDPVSMLEFESLSRELPGHCTVIEKEWLPALSASPSGS